MDTRLTQLEVWLKNELNDDTIVIERASEDASFRRYFRVFSRNATFIAMDAPPEKEDCEPFIRVTEILRNCGVHAPQLYGVDLDSGFLLLEDLGHTDYLSELNALENANKIYAEAMNSLLRIQSQPAKSVILANYDRSLLSAEMQLFVDWYLIGHHSVHMNSDEQQIWDRTKELLISNCLEQPQVLVHRDFHSRNLMITEENSPGVIDYQDMVIGPITYDLASLFKDCYVEWNRSDQLRWLRDFYNKIPNPHFEFAKFVKWYDLTGLQRHLKVLGIFCRLNYRDSKPGYMNDLPLVAKYVLEVLEIYPELDEFRTSFSTSISMVIE